jgi:hypothetical protein
VSATYADVLEGLHERFATVEGIAACLDYEPKSVQTFPLLYSMLDTMEITRTGQVKGRTYRTLHRLLFKWQDNEQALAQMIPYVDSIPDAVDADKHLGGRVTSGLAVIDECEAMFVTIGGVECLALDFYSTVLVK